VNPPDYSEFLKQIAQSIDRSAQRDIYDCINTTVGLLTLISVVIGVCLTLRALREARRQTHLAVRPLLTSKHVAATAGSSEQSALALENIGDGVALNIQIGRIEHNGNSIEFTPIGLIRKNSFFVPEMSVKQIDAPPDAVPRYMRTEFATLLELVDNDLFASFLDLTISYTDVFDKRYESRMRLMVTPSLSNCEALDMGHFEAAS